MIRLRDVTLRVPVRSSWWQQRHETLLEKLNCDIPCGQITLLAGASGSGKTLLARAILDVLPKRVNLIGQIERPLQTAYLPQAISHLDPSATIGQQIRRSRTAQNILPKTLTRLYPYQLSGGEARRALISLMPQATAVVADEPTTGLDAATSAQIMALLTAKAKAGAAVLLITHDLVTALPYCSQVILLQAKSVAAIHLAKDFAQDGARLSAAARAFWRALPQNGFHHD